jgi:putative ABC transport system permease protein
MLGNYLKVALRNLSRNLGYGTINVIGLAIGMAACILILLYINDELSYDRFHADAERIYRVVDDETSGGQTILQAGTPTGWGPALQREFPSIESHTRMRGTGTAWLITFEDIHFYEKKITWAEANLFEVFDFPLVSGTPQSALSDPYTMVVSEDMAMKYFGTLDAVGRTINVDKRWDFRVSAVMRNTPTNSHLRPDMFASYETIVAIGDLDVADWEDHDNFYTYLKLRKDADPKELEAQLGAFIERHIGDTLQKAGKSFAPSLQPLTDIHLHSNREGEHEANGNYQYVLLFMLIAFLVPVIAGINFMNLATARSVMRSREVGVRKVLGASRSQLMAQFMGETVILAACATAVAILLVLMSIPTVNTLAGKQLAFPLDNGLLLAALAASPFVIGLGAGSYPALFLSSFAPVTVLKGGQVSVTQGVLMRKGLVVVQFTMSIFLLISTAVIQDQLGYIQSRRLGFNKEHVLVVPIVGSPQREITPAIKARASQLPGVIAFATTNAIPGMRIMPLMPVRPEGMAPEEELMMTSIEVDENYLTAMEIELLAGRNFSPDWGTDSTTGFLLNETAVKFLGWGTPLDAIGKRFEWVPYGGAKGRVIGVVKDFHLRTIHDEIEPMVIFTNSYHSHIIVRIDPNRMQDTIADLRAVWTDVDPRYPLDFTFMDQDFDSLYRSDEQVGEIFTVFAALALFVACLGLMGLASLATQQRTKEIGVRKVLGASIPSVIMLLSRQFTILVVVANLFAWPLAYFVMADWLRSFAYATPITPGLFVVGGLAALLIAWCTVALQTLRFARMNPVESLRYE